MVFENPVSNPGYIPYICFNIMRDPFSTNSKQQVFDSFENGLGSV